jgi:hypothetical protein
MAFLFSGAFEWDEYSLDTLASRTLMGTTFKDIKVQ